MVSEAHQRSSTGTSRSLANVRQKHVPKPPEGDYLIIVKINTPKLLFMSAQYDSTPSVTPPHDTPLKV